MLPLSAPIRFGSIRAGLPAAARGQRVGLFGGSFNPAHFGHLNASRIALRRLGLDRVWWIVSPGNPLKADGRVDDFEARLKAAQAFARADHRIIVTGFEEGLPSRYTAATLAFVRCRYPLTQFVWLMGADNLSSFHRWMNWRAILQTVPVAVIDRPSCRLAALSSQAARAYRGAYVEEARAGLLAGMPPPAWCFLTGPMSAESSTRIRAHQADTLGRDRTE